MSPNGEAIVQLAWTQLWQVTLVAMIVAIVVRLACRRRPHLAYVLWLVVLVKCLTPPLWSSPTSLFSWAQASPAAVTQTVNGPLTTVAIESSCGQTPHAVPRPHPGR